jgi:hypothetical protein
VRFHCIVAVGIELEIRPSLRLDELSVWVTGRPVYPLFAPNEPPIARVRGVDAGCNEPKSGHAWLTRPRAASNPKPGQEQSVEPGRALYRDLRPPAPTEPEKNRTEGRLRTFT